VAAQAAKYFAKRKGLVRWRGVIEIFTNYPDLVDNDRVWKGWIRKEGELRERKFWLGGDVYEWFDAIEEEYRRIDLELKSARSD